MRDPRYSDRLREEAAVWNAVAAEQAATVAPDWSAHRRLRHNAVQYTRHVDALLQGIRPGMRVLEIGCNSGWLTIAMARRGAIAHGVDIADSAIAIARDYYRSNRDHLSGVATYEVADLNDLALAEGFYDLIVAKGILHHLAAADALIERLHQSLAPGGLLWVSDTYGTEAWATAAIAGMIMLVVPTEVSYRDKLRGLARFGRQAPDRIKASMEACGLSPFEGVGRDADWLTAIRRLFEIEYEYRHAAFTGYIASQLRAPDPIAGPFLRLMSVADRALVRVGILKSTGLTIHARKRPLRP